MATTNKIQLTTISAGEDLRECRYHAIALDDGKIAVNGKEACGLLVGTPNTGEAAAVTILGEEKFKAGAGVSKGAKLAVANSGWLITATSGSWVCGRAKDAVSSGSFGTGYFNFINPPYAETSAAAS